jgi:hypothetical protein
MGVSVEPSYRVGFVDMALGMRDYARLAKISYLGCSVIGPDKSLIPHFADQQANIPVWPMSELNCTKTIVKEPEDFTFSLSCIHER